MGVRQTLIDKFKTEAISVDDLVDVGGDIVVFKAYDAVERGVPIGFIINGSKMIGRKEMVRQFGPETKIQTSIYNDKQYRVFVDNGEITSIHYSDVLNPMETENPYTYPNNVYSSDHPDDGFNCIEFRTCDDALFDGTPVICVPKSKVDKLMKKLERKKKREEEEIREKLKDFWN